MIKNLDTWQQEILDCDGDILLCKGRRIGGTEVFSYKAVEEMLKGYRIVMVSHVEDQAKLIINFALDYIHEKYKKEFHLTKDKKPTQTTIQCKSGGWLKVRPVGNTGAAVRGFDGDILGVDEAPLQPRQMWAAARPIIATNAGRIWMWGTPQGKEGYFWEQFDKIHNLKKKGRFSVWYKNTEEILEERQISGSWTKEQQEGLRKILDQEKEDMSTLEYGQEYLGLFMEDLQRLFTDEMIEKVRKVKRGEVQGKLNYLGVDIARLGEDLSAFSIVTKRDDKFFHLETETTSKTLTTDTERKIEQITRDWKCLKVGIDAGSGTLGVSVLDHLLEIPHMKGKVVALNKRSISMDKDGKVKQQLFGEDMYLNLKSMMEHDEIAILDDNRVWTSLRSVIYEYVKAPNQRSRLRIFSPRHTDSDIVESLIRAAYLAKKEKSKNFDIHYI